MNWDELIGQQPAKAYLRSALTSRRMAHAYLFQGPAGVGKRTAACIFAQTALCHDPQRPDQACGSCKSCRWFAARKGALIEHPDVINLIKFSKGEQRVQRLVGDHEPVIGIETIQYVCEQLHRSPMSGERRAVIIPEAQRFCRGQSEAANAFLKTLEEPPSTALIILTSSQPEALLETIVSRVQQIQFRRLSLADIHSGLTRNAASHDATERELAATLSDGSLGRALELLLGDLKKWRDAVLKSLQNFKPRNSVLFGVALWTLAEAEGKRLFEQEKASGQVEESVEEDADLDGADENEVKTEAGWKRYVFRRLLELCEACFRDGLMVAAGGGTAMQPLLLQPDHLRLSQMIAENFGEEGCQRALSALREALLAVRLYVRGDVVARALAGRFCEALRVGKTE